MARPCIVLLQQLELVVVGACGYLISSAVDTAVEFVEDAVILVQVAQLHSRLRYSFQAGDRQQRRLSIEQAWPLWCMHLGRKGKGVCSEGVKASISTL